MIIWVLGGFLLIGIIALICSSLSKEKVEKSCGCAYLVHDDLLLEGDEIQGIKSPLDPGDLPLQEVRVNIREKIEKYGCYRPTLALPPYPNFLKVDCLIDRQNYCDYQRFLRDLVLIEGERRNMNLLAKAYHSIVDDLQQILLCNTGVKDPWKTLIIAQIDNYLWAEKILLQSVKNQNSLEKFQEAFFRTERVLSLCE